MNFLSNKAKACGQALIEFAILLPVLVLLIFGMIEISWGLYIRNTLVDVARQGALMASTQQNASTSSIITELDNMLTTASIPVNQVTINIIPSGAISLQPKGTAITVQVSLPYSSVSILPTSMFLGAKTISSSVTMAKSY